MPRRSKQCVGLGFACIEGLIFEGEGFEFLVGQLRELLQDKPPKVVLAPKGSKTDVKRPLAS